MTETPPMPDGEFDVIYADPPWRYESGTTLDKWSIEEHYPTMSLSDIKDMDIPAAEDSLLYLWVTSPKLQEGMEVMDAWDFNYRTSAVWHKTTGLGMGHYFRIDHELILIGRRGDASSPDAEKLRTSVFQSPRGEHSEKPDEVRAYIERAHPDKDKLELFSRDGRVGWTMWGNETVNEPQSLLDQYNE